MSDIKNEIVEVKDRKIGSFYTSLQNFEDGQRVANMIAQSTMVPDAYKNNLPNCMVALEMAAKMGVSPTTVMQNLVPIKGKISWSATFVISMVNQCGIYERLRLVIEGQGQNMSCFAWTVELETREKKVGTRISMAMAKAEGWTNNKKWQSMPEQMLKYRAAAFFAREHCPELLNGLYTSDEVSTFDNPSPLDNIPVAEDIQYKSTSFDDTSEDIVDVVTEEVNEVEESVIIKETLEDKISNITNKFAESQDIIDANDDDDGPGF